MAKRKFDPVHPGVVLAEDFLKGMEISQYRLAKGIGVPARRINEIVHGKRSITADIALRLGKFFSMDAQFWMNLQSHYDLEIAKDAIAGKLEREVEVLKSAA
jgi:addiction module HigA family antidote